MTRFSDVGPSPAKMEPGHLYAIRMPYGVPAEDWWNVHRDIEMLGGHASPGGDAERVVQRLREESQYAVPTILVTDDPVGAEFAGRPPVVAPLSKSVSAAAILGILKESVAQAQATA